MRRADVGCAVARDDVYVTAFASILVEILRLQQERNIARRLDLNLAAQAEVIGLHHAWPDTVFDQAITFIQYAREANGDIF